MENTLSWIDASTCTSCGACAAVCPNRVLKKEPGGMSFRSDRLWMCFRCGQCMAVCPTGSVHAAGLSFERDFFDLPEPTRDPQAFFHLIASRRAVRSFQERPVPHALLEKVVQAIQFAPPGFPPIKTELIVVESTERVRAALPHLIALYDRLVKAVDHPVARWVVRRSAGAEKYHTLVQHVVPLMKARLPELKAGTEDTITRGAPAMILFLAHRKAENFRADLYIALTYGFLAAHALGLGGSAMDLIPPAVERSPALREMFGISPDHEVGGALILGYPKYTYRRGIRRELKRVTWL
jgi:ferredoxin